MPLTRAQVETILIRRTGRLLDAAELDGATVDGTNTDLNDPIGWAVRQCGGTVTAITAVTDADLITVSDSDKLLDFAELRALESAFQNYDAVDITAGPRTEKLGQLGMRLESAIARKRAEIEARYGTTGAFSVVLTRTDGYADLAAELV